MFRGCPFCNLPPNGGETHWEPTENGKFKTITYDCGTSLELERIRNIYKPKFINRCTEYVTAKEHPKTKQIFN